MSLFVIFLVLNVYIYVYYNISEGNYINQKMTKKTDVQTIYYKQLCSERNKI